MWFATSCSPRTRRAFRRPHSRRSRSLPTSSRSAEARSRPFARSTLTRSFARSSGAESADDARRSLARHVYWRTEELASERTRTLRLPPAMVWIGQLAQLQRTCLALCLFGGLTHREAAALVGLSPMAVAGLLTSGLKELGQLAGGEPAPVAD